jgi:SurA N-terminal domain
VRRQVGRLIVAVVAAGAVVSGCGSGPSQVGSAVIVGSTAVPLADVQSRLDVALGKSDAIAQLAESGVGAPEIARDVVTRAVLHDLLARTAADEGIVVTDAEVDAALEANGGAEATLAQSLYDLPSLRERVRDRLIAVRHAQRVLPGLTVTADLVAATSREDAAEKARLVAAGGPEADALFAQSQQTARRGVSYQASASPEAAATVLFGLPPGRTAYFQPNPGQSSWVVVQVTDRRTDPAAGSTPTSLGESDLATIGERLLQPLAEQIGVRVNPRYGVWDPISMSVLPPSQVEGAILPATGV